MMTKQDFIALADWIRTAKGYGVDEFNPKQVDKLAAFCKQRNSRFNRSRWLGYINGECGPNGGKILKTQATAAASEKCRTTYPEKFGRSESKPE